MHRRILESRSGGGAGIRDLQMLESALAQPKLTFGGSDLYPSLVEKAAALCLSIVNNHPFVDGNKRVANAGMESFLPLNGAELQAGVDEQEQGMLALASAQMSRGVTDRMVERAYRPQELMNGQQSGNHWLALRSSRPAKNGKGTPPVRSYLRQEPGAVLPHAGTYAGSAG